MEVIGRIIVALPEVSGTSSRGNAWKKREYVLETFETYPKKIFFDFFGERADQYPLNVGDTVKLSFDIESREYNGRWFTSIRGWKSEPAQEGAPMGQQPMQNPTGFVPAGQAFPTRLPRQPIRHLSPLPRPHLPQKPSPLPRARQTTICLSDNSAHTSRNAPASRRTSIHKTSVDSH